MNTADIVIVLIVGIFVILGIRPTLKHFKGQGGCCGQVDSLPDKKLKESIIGETVLKVEGMTCENCANRIKKALNQCEHVSAQVFWKKKKVIIEYSKEIDMPEIKRMIQNLGYDIV